MAHTFTRQELYDLVWTEPMRTVAKRLGVSDVWLRKNCVAANIPVPGLGFWARKLAGQEIRRVPFPERGLGQCDEIVIGRQPAYWYPQNAEAGEIPPLKTFPESLNDVRQRARKLVGRVTASRSLDKPHPLIASLLNEDERRRAKLQETLYVWEKPRFDETEGRRQLRILNGLFLGLARAGAIAGLSRKDPLEWAVRIGDTSISVSLEAIKEKRSPRSNRPGRPSRARLRLSLHRLDEFPELVTSWEDQDGKAIEQQVGDIAVAILVHGEMTYQAGVIRHHQWLIERREQYLEEQRRKKEAEERRRQEELLRQAAERRKRLVSDAQAWCLATDIRGFIEAVRGKLAQSPGVETEESVQGWLVWAVAEAERIDPILKPLAELTDYAPPKQSIA